MRNNNNIGESKLEELKKTKFKKCTEKKMLWAVRAYNDWRSVRLSDYATFDIRIPESDLNDVAHLRIKEFEYSLCKFIAEVVKVKDGKDYPGATLYQLYVGIHKFLISKGKNWKLIDGFQFDIAPAMFLIMSWKKGHQTVLRLLRDKLICYLWKRKIECGSLGCWEMRILRNWGILCYFNWLKSWVESWWWAVQFAQR